MRLSPKLAVSLLSLAIVLALFALDTQRNSPGELSPVHARLAELSGNDGCDKCHGGFAQSMPSACLDCHTEIAKSLEQKRGLHGKLSASNCARCHAEHHGADLEIAGTRAFALAGIPDRERYDHADLGFALAGRHSELSCSGCHANADVALLEAGQSRFVGLSQDCASCHDDPHAGRMARACADCHGQSEPFTRVAAFEHADVSTSRGAHARAACGDCHSRDGPNSVEALGSAAAPTPSRTCEDCHASPHRPEFIAGATAKSASIARDGCLSCHDPDKGSFRDAQTPAASDWHAASGFALIAPHDTQACAACHAASGAASADPDETTDRNSKPLITLSR